MNLMSTDPSGYSFDVELMGQYVYGVPRFEIEELIRRFYEETKLNNPYNAEQGIDFDASVDLSNGVRLMTTFNQNETEWNITEKPKDEFRISMDERWAKLGVGNE